MPQYGPDDTQELRQHVHSSLFSFLHHKRPVQQLLLQSAYDGKLMVRNVHAYSRNGSDTEVADMTLANLQDCGQLLHLQLLLNHHLHRLLHQALHLHHLHHLAEDHGCVLQRQVDPCPPLAVCDLQLTTNSNQNTKILGPWPQSTGPPRCPTVSPASALSALHKPQT